MIKVESIITQNIKYVALAAITILVYIMGAVTIASPDKREFALQTTPIALIVSIAALLIFREKRYSYKTIVAYTTILILSWLVEAVGVNSGLIFGDYSYGSTLGYTILATPILIGFNWLFLVIISQSIASFLKLKGVIAIISSSLLMVYYDTILEEVAPLMGMWKFSSPVVPISNYIGWFVVALILNTLSYKIDREETNFMAIPLLLLQILLFISIIFIL